MNSIVDLLAEKNGVSREGGGFVQGIVTDNADKDHAGMVKVEFTAWKQGENIHEWIPVLRPYAGTGYGVYATPEVGDTVLVGFVGSGFRKPIVFGSLSPASNELDSGAFEEKNNLKRLKTRGGVECTLSDEDDKQSLTVKTPKGLSAEFLDENEQIRIQDEGGKNILTIDAKEGEVSVKADKKMSFTCGSCTITFDGSSGAMELKCGKLTLEASQTASFKGGQQLAMEGAALQAEGKQMLTLKGGTLTQIEGSVVKIN